MLPRFSIFLVMAGMIGFSFFSYRPPQIQLPSSAELHSAFTPVPAGGLDSTWVITKELDEKLKNCDLVLLGEAQHGDGATFTAKAGWIRYLHERYHFDVLLLESGLWAGFILDQDLRMRHSDPETVGRHIWFFWGKAAETATLWPYLAQHGVTSGGFDLQFTGAPGELPRQFQQILERAGQQDTTLFGHTRHWLEKVDISSLNGYHTNPAGDERTKMLEELNGLRDTLAQRKYPEAALDRLSISNLLWNLEYWSLPTDARNPFRDSIMATNILEFQKTLPQGHRKMVIWAANAHILHQDAADPVLPFKTMGDYLFEKVGKETCTVLFSSFDGQTRNIYSHGSLNLYAAGSSSIEYALENEQLGEGILNFGRLSASARFKSRALGHGNHLAPWLKMADGLYFIPHMTPYQPIIPAQDGSRD